MPPDTLPTHALTPDRWPDLEDLFGPERGASSGCWCMWPRLVGAEFKAMARAGRKDAFRSIVEAGPPPGLLAYDGGRAVGWCAVGPRASFARFQRAKSSRPTEEEQAGPNSSRVHAITCFYVRTGYRRQGMKARLTAAAIDLARRHGALAIDACPIESDRPHMWGEGFVGSPSMFASFGFREIARRSPRRPLMRLRLSGTDSGA